MLTRAGSSAGQYRVPLTAAPSRLQIRRNYLEMHSTYWTPPKLLDIESALKLLSFHFLPPTSLPGLEILQLVTKQITTALYFGSR
ncbi:hypothetical protein CPB84DRAFT_1785062 [Gymnopilus junonius]|uniref:Uncharacterized protein n=1 Tax=Gymnopilus junonius TaxID=109634 RepID=A0A9P5NJ78_GYMJU|nr:hypothetical protein CPB84DRAFT_1785062 [Gymnopilus junonius]